jgi:hypothetical protein
MKTDPLRNSLPTARIAEPEVDTYEEISSRAYELYVERGREDGRDLEDWLQAEMEVAARRTRPAAA